MTDLTTAKGIVDAIGKDRLMAALGVGWRTTCGHMQDGKLPASWFDLCERLTGETLDRRLFRFKGVE